MSPKYLGPQTRALRDWRLPLQSGKDLVVLVVWELEAVGADGRTLSSTLMNLRAADGGLGTPDDDDANEGGGGDIPFGVVPGTPRDFAVTSPPSSAATSPPAWPMGLGTRRCGGVIPRNA